MGREKGVILTMLLCCLSLDMTAQPYDYRDREAADTAVWDSVTFSLLTCSPGQRIYELFGHTGIRYRFHRNDTVSKPVDMVFSYGMFSFKKSFFVLRFLFGLTDYNLAVIPTRAFLAEYEKRGSAVMEQVLNLTAEEKKTLLAKLNDNAKPWNRTYRYNYFYDNCTTRARDIIESSSKRAVITQGKSDGETYRSLVHQYTKGHEWMQCGIDLCLGVKSDMTVSERQAEFLPEVLMSHFARSPIVKTTNIIVKPGVQIIKRGFPLSPMECAAILLIISVMIMTIEIRRKRVCRLWDIPLMVAAGLGGVIILALFIGEHPTTSTNLQILLFNPLTLVLPFLRGKHRTLFMIWGALLVVFLLGGIWQRYADGAVFLALCLLTRVVSHLKTEQ